MDSKLMKIVKWFILITIILIICILLILLLKNKKLNDEDKTATPSTHIDSVEINKKIEKINNKNDYFIVKNCVNTFYLRYSQIYSVSKNDFKLEDDESNVENAKKENIQIIYDMLDDDYIKYKNITMDNLESKLSKINKVYVDINNIYVCSQNENFDIYFVYGNIIDISQENSSEMCLMLKVDKLNRTFKVLLQDYVQKYYNDIEIGKELDIEVPNKIESKTYNVYKFENITDETYLNDIFESCKNELLYNCESIYSKFDDEYKNSRFKTIEELKEYIKNNRKKIVTMELSKYQKNVYDNYTEYVCIDSNNKYYIINVTSPLEYTITLDTYTINTPEFKEKYDNVDNTNKVGLNLEKIKQAINEKDYRYVYNRLNKQFKENNYSEYDVFKNEIKENLFDTNKFEYESIEENQLVYVSKIKVTNDLNENESKDMNIIMKLNENYEFEISFSFE